MVQSFSVELPFIVMSSHQRKLFDWDKELFILQWDFESASFKMNFIPF